ncbi:hypothetical protein NCS52_00806100 [Fusarium sp. LHS14.1]|nr:hypothetical protein NCS52_00806100 [Fusarium sp. LHS14.1]
MQCEAGQFSEDSNKHAQTDNGTHQTPSNLSINFQASSGQLLARLQVLRPQPIPNALCGAPIDRAPPFGTGPPQAEALSSLKRAVANSAHLPPRTFSDKSPSPLPNILSFLFSPPSTAACNSLLFGCGLAAVPRQTPCRTSPRRPPFLRREIYVFNKGPAPVVLCPWEGRGRALPPRGGAASSPSSNRHVKCVVQTLARGAPVQHPGPLDLQHSIGRRALLPLVGSCALSSPIRGLHYCGLETRAMGFLFVLDTKKWDSASSPCVFLCLKRDVHKTNMLGGAAITRRRSDESPTHRCSYPTKGRASTRTRNTISTHHGIISQCWHNGPPYSATTPEPLLPVHARPLPNTTTPEPLAQPLSIPFFYLTRSQTKSLVLAGQISVPQETPIASIARVGVPVQLLRCWGYLLPALTSPRVKHVLRHRS